MCAAAADLTCAARRARACWSAREDMSKRERKSDQKSKSKNECVRKQWDAKCANTQAGSVHLLKQLFKHATKKSIIKNTKIYNILYVVFLKPKNKNKTKKNK